MASSPEHPEHKEHAEHPDSGEPDEAERARAAFERGLRQRGDAVTPGEGELPPGATHEIVENEEGGQTVRRRRFSAY